MTISPKGDIIIAETKTTARQPTGQEVKHEKKRYFCKTNAYNCVVFVDENSKGFMIYENLFDEELTIDVAKSASYSNLDGCETAEECAYSIGTPQAMQEVFAFDPGEFEYIEEF